MANIKISDLTAAASVSGTQQFEVNEAGTSKKVTGAQIAAYVEGEVSSSPSFTGQASVAAGSAAAPSVTVTGDTNTGVYFPAADTVGISTGGTLRVSVDSSGSLVTAGNIELGNATDTTISRVSGGVIAVEGVSVPLNSVTNTHTAQQIELGHATDTTLTRVSGGVIAVEGQTLATQAYVTSSLGSATPSGALMPFAGTTEPSGWFFCEGRSLSTTTYATLFAAIGYTYGGSGASFNLPDLRGRVIAGKDDMGGTSANRLTGLSGGVNGDTLGGTGGAETHTLTVDEMPAHTHSSPTSNGTANSSSTATSVASNTDGTTGSRGGSLAHNNVQPTIILNYIIKV